MLAGGVAATAGLVLWAGYPASMVGVNGAKISNLNPPTLAVVSFGVAQVGLALLLREPLARWMRRPLAWAAVATANLSAMDLFLWSQTVFLIVTMAGLLAWLPGCTPRPSPRRGSPSGRLAAGLRRRTRRLVAGVPPVRAGAAAQAPRPGRR